METDVRAPLRTAYNESQFAQRRMRIQRDARVLDSASELELEAMR